jgi:hypothetical protein
MHHVPKQMLGTIQQQQNDWLRIRYIICGCVKKHTSTSKVSMDEREVP